MEPEQGDRVRVITDSAVYEGTLMPGITDHIIIKLSNGYNVGVARDAQIELIEKRPPISQKPVEAEETIEQGWRDDLPTVAILSTGGTIASRVDYRTGAVTSQFTAEDILNAIPELREIANYRSRVVRNILSENMRAEYWIELARAVAEEINNGADGVIITHGTDTLGYTASALSFMIKTPVPIVLVGSQRSSDRPSSDSAMNAICAASVAVSDIAEVCVVMHGSTSDDYCLIHRGTRVRKMHTSRRDAFQSIGAAPIGRIEYPTCEITTFDDYVRRGEREPELHDEMEPKCALLKYIPGASPELLRFCSLSGYKGIVIEGTGLGHVSSDWIPLIEFTTSRGIPVVITSQCLHGRICDRVYDTGRDMLKAGVIEAEDMLSEVALVKLMWLLGQRLGYEEVCAAMKENIAGEISESSGYGTVNHL
ncbi:Glu-tRNA(Gln) amidotransferase GatDE subunit D [ANME-2 cluster archaeon]|nr:MAG: Glu-tRNA(Gln) amidotransferase GatDE subunit D [ANME-2 cluster archaeon]RLG24042.1 MAG: Glu-tRNA(Gln) amidotransferase GatDE subunit D [Methanosarcinales archaeon]